MLAFHLCTRKKEILSFDTYLLSHTQEDCLVVTYVEILMDLYSNGCVLLDSSVWFDSVCTEIFSLDAYPLPPSLPLSLSLSLSHAHTHACTHTCTCMHTHTHTHTHTRMHIHTHTHTHTQTLQIWAAIVVHWVCIVR